MTRNIVIQVFLDEKQHNDVKEAAATRKIIYKTPSDMIRKILFDYTEKIANLVVTTVMVEGKMAGLKEQLAQKEAVIEAQRHKMSDLQNDIEVLRSNLAIQSKDAKHDHKI